MAGREVREYTNLSDPKDKKLGKGGRDTIDDEDITFQRMVAKVNGCGILQVFPALCAALMFFDAALDSDDLLYLKEQMEAEQDAERLLRHTKKRAFAAFKKAASLADSSSASVPLPLRVEPKPKSGIRQQDLLKKVVEVKPKKLRVSSPSDGSNPTLVSSSSASEKLKTEVSSPSDRNHPIHISINPLSKVLKSEVAPEKEQEQILLKSNKAGQNEVENPVKSLLGLAYASSDDED